MNWLGAALCALTIAVLPGLPACGGKSGKTSAGEGRGTAGGPSHNGGSSGVSITPGAGGPGFNFECDETVPGSPCNPDTPVPAGCGDGKLTEDEACDDGNLNDGDGCQANCLATQPGFSCSPPGKPCHELVICGDKIVGSSEQCDDGNKVASDGCSTACKFETGFKCDGQPSVCTPTVCGDGKKDGDGCSSACKKEGGFECSQKANCEKINDACILRVPVVYRDLTDKHPDVEPTCT